MMKDERGSAGVYILSMIFITCIIFMTTYFAVAGQVMNVRTMALSRLEEAGKDTLMANIEYDLPKNQYVISASQSRLEQDFPKRLILAHYTINKFLVLNKGDKDPQGYNMAQPGFYIELNLPIAGFDVPIGEDFVVPPYNEQTKTWIK